MSFPLKTCPQCDCNFTCLSRKYVISLATLPFFCYACSKDEFMRMARVNCIFYANIVLWGDNRYGKEISHWLSFWDSSLNVRYYRADPAWQAVLHAFRYDCEACPYGLVWTDLRDRREGHGSDKRYSAGGHKRRHLSVFSGRLSWNTFLLIWPFEIWLFFLSFATKLVRKICT